MIFEIVAPDISKDSSVTGASSGSPSLREPMIKALTEKKSLPGDLNALTFEPGRQTIVLIQAAREVNN